MSQAGYLAWYTNAELDERHAIHLLRELPKLIGFERAEGVYRDDLDDYLASDYLGSELFRLYKHGSVLRIEADEAAMGNRIESLIKKIPENVRGDFLPNQPFIRIGQGGYFIDAGDDMKNKVRFTAMVGCWGYSTPADTEQMRKHLATDPGIHAEKVKLEHLMGDLKQSLYLKF